MELRPGSQIRNPTEFAIFKKIFLRKSCFLELWPGARIWILIPNERNLIENEKILIESAMILIENEGILVENERILNENKKIRKRKNNCN